MIRSTLLIFAIALSTIIAAQTAEEIREQMIREFEQSKQEMQNEYNQYVKDINKEYNDYVNQINEEFETFLKKPFKEVEDKAPIVEEKPEPKPVEQPTFEEEVEREEVDLEKLSDIEPETEPFAIPEPVVTPVIENEEVTRPFRQKVTIDFFGSALTLNIDKRTSALALSSVTPEGFAKYWGDFTKLHYTILHASVNKIASETNLNDWGKFQLVNKTAQKIFPSKNNQLLYCWAMLNQMGYRAKIGYLGSKVELLIPFTQQVFGETYYKINGENYYAMGNAGIKENLYTYIEDFGGAAYNIDLNLPGSLTFPNSTFVDKTTQIPGQSTPVALKVNKTTMLFLNSFPHTDEEVYLNASFSMEIKEKLFNQLASYLEGHTDVEKAGLLLKYLHQSFEYKTDIDQFKREKMFFPDEIFYYPYSDCEDRSVLYTKLVTQLLGLDAIGVIYFNHMAAAIAFNEEVEGVSYTVDNKKFTICDPTYLNAPVGSVMPKYEGYSPIAVKVYNPRDNNKTWSWINNQLLANNKGSLFISDRKLSESNQYVLSGWFQGNISVNGKSYASAGSSRDLWFASYSPNGKQNWFVPLACNGNGFAQAVNVGKMGNAYAILCFTGDISVQGKKVSSTDREGYAVFGIGNNANVMLLEQIEIGNDASQKLAFYGKYHSDGTKVDLLNMPLSNISFDSQITIDSKNDIIFRGVVGEIEGLSAEVQQLSSAASFSATQQIEDYMSQYRQQSFDPKVIGLFASVRLLSQNGGTISGNDVKALLQKHSPGFSKKNPGIYKSLSDLKFVVNKGGIVKIETLDGDKVALDMMSVKNNSNMKISKVSDISFKLSFMNGVEVGKAFIWFDLNSIMLSHDGNLLFDYDDDHTKKKVPLNDIID